MTQHTHPSASTSSTAIIIGRWQIWHKGHETLLTAALNVAEQVIVVIGSAFKARNMHNPFNAEERQAMILAGLSAQERQRVRFLPVRDYYDDLRWNAAVRAGIDALTQGRDGPTILVGFKKDHTSYYLDHFPQWQRHDVAQEFDIDATALRNVFFDGTATDARLAVLQPYVNPAVLDYLQAWSHLGAYGERVREHQAVIAYRKRWTADCYLTADALLQANGHVLLVRRGGEVGYGQWAVPGGFVDKNERFYSAAVRELEEETGFRTLDSTMRQALKNSAVFDHPQRSPRARIVTQAFHFDLGAVRLPEVKGADDALEARWIPVTDLARMENQLFEDHAAILDRFVGVYR